MSKGYRLYMHSRVPLGLTSRISFGFHSQFLDAFDRATRFREIIAVGTEEGAMCVHVR